MGAGTGQGVRSLVGGNTHLVLMMVVLFGAGDALTVLPHVEYGVSVAPHAERGFLGCLPRRFLLYRVDAGVGECFSVEVAASFHRLLSGVSSRFGYVTLPRKCCRGGHAHGCPINHYASRSTVKPLGCVGEQTGVFWILSSSVLCNAGAPATVPGKFSGDGGYL